MFDKAVGTTIGAAFFNYRLYDNFSIIDLCLRVYLKFYLF